LGHGWLLLNPPTNWRFLTKTLEANFLVVALIRCQKWIFFFWSLILVAVGLLQKWKHFSFSYSLESLWSFLIVLVNLDGSKQCAFWPSLFGCIVFVCTIPHKKTLHMLVACNSTLGQQGKRNKKKVPEFGACEEEKKSHPPTPQTRSPTMDL